MFLFVHFKIFLFCFWGDSYSPSLTVYYTHASYREEQRSHFLALEEFGIQHPKIMRLWYIDNFELKSLGKQLTQGGALL